MNSVHTMFFLGGMLVAFLGVFVEQNIIYACSVDSMTLEGDNIVTVIRVEFNIYGMKLWDHKISYSDKLPQFSEEARAGTPFDCRVSFMHPSEVISRPINKKHFTGISLTKLLLFLIYTPFFLLVLIYVHRCFGPLSIKGKKQSPPLTQQASEPREQDELSRNIGLGIDEKNE